MKKLIIITFTIIISTVIILYITNDKKVSNRNLPFYKKENKARYEEYKKRYPTLSKKDIIIRVNLNLDKDFYQDIKPSKYLDKNYVLINKFLYVDKSYVPSDLKKISICTKGNIYLKQEALKNFEKMCLDIKKEGLKIRAISAYRDYNYQFNLYNKYLKYDNKKKVDTYSARAGHSEHQSGLVVDIDNYITSFDDFESTDEYIWMVNNSYKYGFILRYPKKKEDITGYSYESWHYRYVGKDIAYYIKKHNITFDEYYALFIDV